MGLPLAAGLYGIDTMHSQLGFAVTHLGISTIRGTFDTFRGSLTVGGSLDDTGLAIEADTSSINTGNRMRDEHVHAGDWLDVTTHPTMAFRSTSIAAVGDAYVLSGELTLKGTTRPVTLRASYLGSNVFPVDGSTHHGFTAAGAIRRSEFGVSFGVPGVSDEVQLLLEAQFIGPAAAGG